MKIAPYVSAKFRIREQTIKGWAERHGYKTDTVKKVIHGLRVSGPVAMRIKVDLWRDGYWPEEAVDQAMRELREAS